MASARDLKTTWTTINTIYKKENNKYKKYNGIRALYFRRIK